MTGPISRRRALQLGGLGLASAAVGATGLAWQVGRGFSPAAGSAFREPLALRSSGGLLQVRLVASRGTVSLAGRQVRTLGYNGRVPGPTLRLWPGDSVQVELANATDQPTNLHTHGLHVSPAGRGDNPFVRIDPGQTGRYEYHVPREHPAGSFWYHPHHHGMAADQVFGGLYGALVIEEVGVEAARERVLVISDISLDATGSVRGATPMERMAGREGDLVLLNGQFLPVLTVRPGEQERWRLVNACVSRYLRLRLEGHDLQLLGVDGGRLPTPRKVSDVLLAPGNRGDLLVTVGSAVGQLVALPHDRGSAMGMMGAASPSARSRSPVVLAELHPAGSATRSSPSPARAATPVRDLRGATVARRRRLGLTMDMAMGMAAGGMRVAFDGLPFDPARVDQQAALGTVEEWTFVNTGPMSHPVHLHVWPMQVVAVDGSPVAEPTWRDVVDVPARAEVTVLVAFEDFPGRTVYHCHILDHEDLGMMGVLEVR